MRVECIAASGAALPEVYVDPVGGYTRQAIFPLSAGGGYVVYAITLRRGGVWYYLVDDRELGYPVWYPAPLFRLVDGRLSRYWVFGFHEVGARDGDAVFAFPEWASDPFGFYNALSDGEAKARETFRRYRDLMELELTENAAETAARDIGDGWLQCAKCNDAWQTTAIGERVRCPHCGLIQQNPRLIGVEG